MRQFWLTIEEARDTPARASQTRHIASRDRIVVAGEHDNWNGRAGCQRGLQRHVGPAADDDRYVRARHRGGVSERPVSALIGAADFGDEVAPFSEPEPFQFRLECSVAWSSGDGILDSGREYADVAGMKTADLCRKHGISEASFYNWKAKYGGLEVSEAKRLKGLESAAEPLAPVRGVFVCRP